MQQILDVLVIYSRRIGRTINYEWEIVQKETFVASVKMLFHCLSSGTEKIKNHISYCRNIEPEEYCMIT
jgi:hypothetical protein